MGFLDRLFGRKEEYQERPASPAYGAPGGGRQPSDDERALQRYRYMLRTAPPEAIEQAHQEAFARLTPDQRAQVLRELAAVTPEGETTLAGGRDDPRDLARLATRAEMRQPGVMERILGGRGMGGIGPGGMMAGTIFGSLVAGFVGSMIADEFFDSIGDFDQGGMDVQPGDEPADGGVGNDSGYGATDDPGGYGDDLGDFGGDWGGGDFGGDDW